MTTEEVRKYQKENPVYYPTLPSLSTNCPVNYNWDDCSSKEWDMRCRTCANYNPLRMLYEKERRGVSLSVPMDVLLDDARLQLK